MKSLSILLSLFFITAVSSGLIHHPVRAQTTINVTTTADELNTDGQCSLREAIETINQGSAQDNCTFGTGPFTVDVPAGTYTLSLTGSGEDNNATGDLDVLVALTLTGAGAGSTIIDGNGTDRAFHLNPLAAASFTVSFSGMTIQNGSVSGSGGGIYGRDNTLTLSNSTISGNATSGGGSRGGGLYLQAGTLSVTSSTISGNTSGGSGGGIYNTGTAATITSSTISGNSATGNRGGGMYNGGATVTVTNSTISGNLSHGNGGGIYNTGTAATITSSTISGNSTNSHGGGLHNVSGTTTLEYSTVASNTVLGVGGGFRSQSGTLNVMSTIVGDNGGNSPAPDCFGTITSQDFNLVEDLTGCTFTPMSNDITGQAPLLAPLASNGGSTQTHLPQLGSPVTDQGTCSSGAVTEGQRGELRPFDDGSITDADDGCDIGAVELSGIELPVELISFDAVLDGAAVLLRWATASETNNAGFEVQKWSRAEAQEGEHWDLLAFVEGHGTTLEAQQYSYRVTDLDPGKHTFRLKQVDFDGSFEYSLEVEVQAAMPERFVLEPAYPNPFNPQTTIKFAVREAHPVRLALYNMLGRRVAVLYEGIAEAGQIQVVRLNGAALSSGLYVVRLVGREINASRQVTLIK